MLTPRKTADAILFPYFDTWIGLEKTIALRQSFAKSIVFWKAHIKIYPMK